jgi:ribose transport system ATP-binding protein
VKGLTGDRIGPVDLELRAGEVVGLFGLLGAGRTELVESLFGARPRKAGEIRIDGRVVDPRTPRQAIRSGIALVPAERARQSLFGSLAVADNLLVSVLARLSRWRWLRRPIAERTEYDTSVRDLQVKADRPTLPVLSLSGGNQQKVVLGRWLVDRQNLKVLLLDEPTQGIDVGTRAELYRLVRQISADQGLCVLLTSSYPEEICAVADRALVLRQGRCVAELSGDALNNDSLLRHANGLTDE